MHAAEGKIPASLPVLISACMDAALGQADPFPVWKAKTSVQVGPLSPVACHSSKPGHRINEDQTCSAFWLHIPNHSSNRVTCLHLATRCEK